MLLASRKLFTSNILICMAIALFLFFLLQTPLLHWILLGLARLLYGIHRSLLLNVSSLVPSAKSLMIDGTVTVICAALWTYTKSPATRIGATLAFGLLLVPINYYLFTRTGTPSISLLVVVGAASGIAIDAAVQFLTKRVRQKLTAEKQDAEFNILRHLNHNVKPNIQMAKSPITSVISFLESRQLLNEPLARRLDGSSETVGEALNNSITSLAHINGILEAARELVAHEIKPEDFEEVGICGLFRSEVIAPYGARLLIALKCHGEIMVRLHRQSFVEAINNLIRNADLHGFQGKLADARLEFRIMERRKSVVIDYTNNGHPFPENLNEKDFLSFGRKSADSPGEGLGGAWIGKVIAAHNGSFEIIRDEHPLHFRISLPKGGY